MRTMEELGDDLCKYCPLDKEQRGTHNYGGIPSFCSDSGFCDTAYENYKGDCTETCVGCGEKIHPDEAEYIKKAADDEYGPLCQKCYKEAEG